MGLGSTSYPHTPSPARHLYSPQVCCLRLLVYPPKDPWSLPPDQFADPFYHSQRQGGCNRPSHLFSLPTLHSAMLQHEITHQLPAGSRGPPSSTLELQILSRPSTEHY